MLYQSKKLSSPGAHASLRAERHAFIKPRCQFKFLFNKRFYAAKRDVARRDACAPGDDVFFVQ